MEKRNEVVVMKEEKIKKEREDGVEEVLAMLRRPIDEEVEVVEFTTQITAEDTDNNTVSRAGRTSRPPRRHDDEGY